MHLNRKRNARPHQRREVLKAVICRRVSELDKTGCDQGALRLYGIFNEKVEVAERTVAQNRIIGSNLRTLHQHQGARIRGPGLAKNETREHRAQCSGAGFSHEFGWNLASMQSPEPGSCEVQMILPQRIEARRRIDGSLDHAGEPDVIVGAGLSKGREGPYMDSARAARRTTR